MSATENQILGSASSMNELAKKAWNNPKLAAWDALKDSSILADILKNIETSAKIGVFNTSVHVSDLHLTGIILALEYLGYKAFIISSGGNYKTYAINVVWSDDVLDNSINKETT